MQGWIGILQQWWRSIRNSSKFRSALTFLIFVGIAALFWLILTLNDSVESSVMMNVKITNKPDSVTFISDVPRHIHVEVRDKGSNLMRTAWLRTPTVNLDFRVLADNDQFVCSRSDMMVALKESFGGNASILSSSIDSLRLIYTSRPGKPIPVVVDVAAHAKAGFVVAGSPKSVPTRVVAYGPREVLDTLNRVYTKSYVESDLDESRSFTSDLRAVRGVRLIPSRVTVDINVEPLVAKEDVVPVVAKNVPSGESLLLFPSKARVSYYVPMSEFSSDVKPVRVVADYDELATHKGARIPLRIEIIEGSLAVRPQLHTDSVEYTLVR